MGNKSTISLICIGICLLLCASCATQQNTSSTHFIEKRHYRPGFFLRLNANKDKQKSKHQKTNALLEDRLFDSAQSQTNSSPALLQKQHSEEAAINSTRNHRAYRIVEKKSLAKGIEGKSSKISRKELNTILKEERLAKSSNETRTKQNYSGWGVVILLFLIVVILVVILSLLIGWWLGGLTGMLIALIVDVILTSMLINAF